MNKFRRYLHTRVSTNCTVKIFVSQFRASTINMDKFAKLAKPQIGNAREPVLHLKNLHIQFSPKRTKTPHLVLANLHEWRISDIAEHNVFSKRAPNMKKKYDCLDPDCENGSGPILGLPLKSTISHMDTLLKHSAQWDSDISYRLLSHTSRKIWITASRAEHSDRIESINRTRTPYKTNRTLHKI